MANRPATDEDGGGGDLLDGDGPAQQRERGEATEEGPAPAPGDLDYSWATEYALAGRKRYQEMKRHPPGAWP